MKARNKRINAKYRGLFHASLRIVVEAVKRSHRKRCEGCQDIPEGQRLLLTFGGGRSATSAVYCHLCGVSWLEDHAVELGRAQRRLIGEDICVRRVQGED